MSNKRATLGVTLGSSALLLSTAAAFAAPGEPLRLYTGERNRETIFGRVTDQNGKPVRAMVELWYYDISQPITVEERDGGPRSIPLAEQYQRTLFQTDFTTDKGWYHVDAVAGEWLVRVHKGPEWSIEEYRVTVRTFNGTPELDGQRHDIKLRQLYDLKKLGWYSGDVHSHSLFSDGTQTPSDMAIAWRANSVDFAALSDHNQNFQHEEFDELADEEFLPFSSVEVTTTSPLTAQQGKGFGHHIAFDVPGNFVDKLPGATDPANPVIFNRYVFDEAADLQRAIDETHAQGGLFHPTHSCWSNDWPAGTFSSWGEVKGFDSIDVFTGWDVGPHLPTVLASEYGESIFGTAQFNMNTVCTQIWFEFLNAGNKIAAWANSDTHDVHSLLTTGAGAPVYWRNTAGNARVFVRSGKLAKKPIKRALKEGRAFVTSGYWGPLLLVRADGKYEPGDTVRVKKGQSSIELDVRVLSNRELKGYDAGIRVIQDGKLVKSLPTHEFEGEMTAGAGTRVPVTKDGWLVVQAFGEWPSMAMTNAIYVDVAPYDDGPGEWQVPAGATGWFNPFAQVDGDTCTFNVPDQTVPDQSEVEPPIPLPPINRCKYRIFR
jgi:hypothetical protein